MLPNQQATYYANEVGDDDVADFLTSLLIDRGDEADAWLEEEVTLNEAANQLLWVDESSVHH